MRAFLLLFCSLTIALVQAQTNARLLRGSIVDKDTHRPLAFSNVGIYRDSVLVGGVSVDSVGRFRFDQLPIGRYTVKATFIGYIPCILSGVELSAGKETVVELALEESAQAMNEVVITAQRKSDALNEMASVSARLFSAEEAQRYAGSRQDAARMASNFAGVQGGDDSRNDIVVRGNSPLGVLWQDAGHPAMVPRNHLRRPPDERGDCAREHRDLRARRLVWSSAQVRARVPRNA